MWYSIQGNIKDTKKDFLVLEVGGMGYKIFTNKETLKTARGNVTLYTHVHVREDAFDVFGFLTEEALLLFEMLISISGVGPKTALGILDLDTIPNTTAAILEKRVDILSKASGIGKKTAERIVLELHTKMNSFSTAPSSDHFDVRKEVEEVLVHLGYPSILARKFAMDAEGKTTEERLRNALRMIGTK